MSRLGFPQRLASWAIDLIPVIIICLIVSMIFVRGVTLDNLASVAYRVNLVDGLLLLGYFSTEIFMAGSPGKLILKQKIVSQTGAPADQAKLATRFAIKQSPLILMFLVGLLHFGALSFLEWLAGIFVIVSCFMTLRPTMLALHDEIAGTAVVGPTKLEVGFPVQMAPTPGVEATPVPPETAAGASPVAPV